MEIKIIHVLPGDYVYPVVPHGKQGLHPYNHFLAGSIKIRKIFEYDIRIHLLSVFLKMLYNSDLALKSWALTVRLSKNLYSLLITLAVRSLTGNWSFVP